MTILQFEKIYSISMTCLRLNGSHPSIPIDKRWAFQAGLMHGLFTIVFVSFAYSLFAFDIKERDFDKACSTGIFMVIWLVVTLQYGVVLWFRDTLKTLIRLNQENFDLAESLPAEDEAVIIEYANRGRWVTKVWLLSVSLNCALFPVKSIILTLYSLYTGEFHLVPWYDNSFPSPLEEHKYEPGVFSLIYSTHLFYGLYAIMMYIGFCPLGPIFILNTCAQLQIVAKEVRNVLNTCVPYNSDVVAQNVSVIVKKIQSIYSHVELINDMFQVLYELSLKASAIMIPISVYQIVYSFKSGEISLEYMPFIFTAALLCYVPCYYSDLLMDKGEELRIAIYECGWQNHYDRSVRNTLLIMLTVAVRPISIRTIFRTVCLDAFAELCHQAYAIFSLINAMWN